MTYSLTAANLHKTVGRDSSGVAHALVTKIAGGNVLAAKIVTRCGIYDWGGIKLLEGFPTCVRCLCSPR